MTATPTSKVAIQAGTFSLDSLVTIVGPVFRFDTKNFDDKKAVVIPRATLNSTIATQGSYSTYRLKAQTAVRLESFGVKKYLIVYKDPETVRANITLDMAVDEVAAVASDNLQEFAYAAVQGLVNFNRKIFVFKTSLVPTQTQQTRGMVSIDLPATDLKFRMLNATHGMLIQLNEYSNDLYAGIYDFSKLTAAGAELSVMNSTRLA